MSPSKLEELFPEKEPAPSHLKQAAIHIPEGIEKQLNFQFKIEIESSLAIPDNKY